MEATIFKYVFRYSMRQQVFGLLLTMASFPFLYLSLDIPKTIINQAIIGHDFPKLILGMQLEQIKYLFVLCGLFLVLVFINGGFKYCINVFKGRMGERMLRRLRYDLYSRVLRFPLSRFRKTSQGEIISMITAEVEPLGGFIGDALALPAFQGGTLLTILTFMFMQDTVLGISAIALYPAQMYLIPRLQQKVNALAKRRVNTVRKLSDRIGETVLGINEVHAHDTSEMELADVSSRLATIYSIRYDIYRKKFFIKFLNNFIAQVTPFFFYSIGGYLVIKGDLSFGALVAVLAAYKDLSSPWKELLRYYQTMEDAKIKYTQLVEQFQPTDIMAKDMQRQEPENIKPLSDIMVAKNLVLEEEGIKTLDGVNAIIKLDKHTAILGRSGSGCSGLAMLIARLLAPNSGSINIGDVNMASLPEAITGRRVAYVGQDARMFSGSVRDNIFYGLKHRPASDNEKKDNERKCFIDEAMISGNSSKDINADWVDYSGAGVSGPDELLKRTLDVMEAVCLHEDIYEFGLQGTINPQKKPEFAASVLEARTKLCQRLKEPAMARLVERFDRDKYNANMTVAENLFFGTPIGDHFNIDRLGENPYVTSILEKAGLTDDFIKTAIKIAEVVIELFKDLPPGHEFFERYSFMDASDLQELQACSVSLDCECMSDLKISRSSMFVSLLFKMVPDRHRLGIVDDNFQSRIIEARRIFADNLPDDLKASVAFFDEDKYNAAASIQDNILFGKLVYGRAQSKRQVGKLIAEVIESMDLTQAVMEVGMDFQVGVGGARLLTGQRQKLAMARCLLKRPDLLVVDEATSALDPASQTKVMENVFRETHGRGLVWVLNQADKVTLFDDAIIMESGKVLQQGSVKELNQPGKPLNVMYNLQG